MNEVYIIHSDTGDEYKLQFTTDRSGVVSDEILDELSLRGIEVVEIGLARSKGINVTSPKVLAQIEECIAEVFLNHPNVLISFFCDFISLVPRTKKKMPVQQYRSLLFTRMFEHYVSHHHIDGISNRVVAIEGVAETYYFHIIARNEHLKYADKIASDHQESYGKPE